ncbi:MAG: hypothetical protein J3Q66DRAFT_326000 [Benniella sp.]|nr:MAG: hypothetical protein J3Q66DRAFT_326000 [Benniella sp.]
MEVHPFSPPHLSCSSPPNSIIESPLFYLIAVFLYPSLFFSLKVLTQLESKILLKGGLVVATRARSLFKSLCTVLPQSVGTPPTQGWILLVDGSKYPLCCALQLQVRMLAPLVSHAALDLIDNKFVFSHLFVLCRSNKACILYRLHVLHPSTGRTSCIHIRSMKPS